MTTAPATPGARERLLAELTREFDCDLLADASLAEYTTLGVGGTAAHLLVLRQVDHLDALRQMLEALGLPIRFLGRGSNLLIAEERFEEVVIKLDRDAAPPRVEGDRVTVGAGAFLPRLTAWLSWKGLSGLEFAEGIPGTVGGAVFMNAGAFGREMAAVVEEITVATPEGLRDLPAAELSWSYRRGPLAPGQWVVQAALGLQPDEPKAVRARMQEYKANRQAHQPLSDRSSGCVFKNPDGDSAGRLIQAAGLGGAREGGAEISSRHCNFIVNRGGATVADVDALLRRARDTVADRFAVTLEEEVQRWTPIA